MTQSLKTTTTTLLALAAAAVGAAAEMQAGGAIRPDHEQKFSGLRVQLDQLAELAGQADSQAADVQPDNPDAAAFERLGERIETLALTVDHLADLAEKAGA